jgi:NAD(P)-dependent dehydrogenase (short-subunit alcohol dehydrogenase family)
MNLDLKKMTILNEKSTALEVIDTFNTDLTGYDVIITGANSGNIINFVIGIKNIKMFLKYKGIGVETAKALAKAGARCLITGRDVERAQQAINEIKESTGNSNIESEKLELDSLESINKFVKNYLAKNRPLHILIKYNFIILINNIIFSF